MNAYHSVVPLPSSPGSASLCISPGSFCCPGAPQPSLNQLLHNTSTTYWGYSTSLGTRKFLLQVRAQQGAHTASQSVDSSQPVSAAASASLSYVPSQPLSAQLSMVSFAGVASNPAPDLSGSVIMFDDHLGGGGPNRTDGFLVPSAYVSSAANCVGIQNDSFVAAAYCTGAPPGQTVRVAGGDPVDQFSAFRPVGVSSAVPNCSFVSPLSSSSTMASGLSSLSFQCFSSTPYSPTTIVLTAELALYPTGFNLVRQAGVLRVLDSGSFPINSGTTSPYFYVDVMNSGQFSGLFTVQPLCCGTTSSTNSTLFNSQNLTSDCMSNSFSSFLPAPVQVTLTTRQTQRLRFPLPATISFPNGSIPFCQVSLFQNSVPEMAVSSISMNGSAIPSNTLTISLASIADQFVDHASLVVGPMVSSSGIPAAFSAQSIVTSCPAPQVKVFRNGLEYCQDACTIDQLLDPATSICNPVNCRVKYSGSLNYYNVDLGICQPAVCSCLFFFAASHLYLTSSLVFSCLLLLGELSFFEL